MTCDEVDIAGGKLAISFLVALTNYDNVISFNGHRRRKNKTYPFRKQNFFRPIRCRIVSAAIVEFQVRSIWPVMSQRIQLPSAYMPIVQPDQMNSLAVRNC